MAETGTKHWQDRSDLHVKFKRSLTLSFTTCNLYEIWTPLTVGTNLLRYRGRTGLHHTHTHALVYTIQSDIHDGINL